MRIIAYTYEADVHCPACTRLYAFRRGQYGAHLGKADQHGIVERATDREGNTIRPVFDIDEHDFTHCGDCGKRLEA